MKAYNVIYADPPWQYNVPAPIVGDRIESKYPTMTDNDIKSLKFPCAQNAVLWLWATSPRLDLAMEVITAWGFKYITCAVWDKGSPGLGHWFRQQHELLLVARKGTFHSPNKYKTIPSVISCKRGTHSEKPFYVRDYLTDIYPKKDGFDKVELFARMNGYLFQKELAEQWDFLGNEGGNNK